MAVDEAMSSWLDMNLMITWRSLKVLVRCLDGSWMAVDEAMSDKYKPDYQTWRSRKDLVLDD